MEVSVKTQSIARANDLFRRDFNRDKIVITQGVDDSPHRKQIIEETRNYKDFNEDNDPYGEHNFGEFLVAGVKYFWKIDYYDMEFEYGADPYETSVYNRVLTIMRADEY